MWPLKSIYIYSQLNPPAEWRWGMIWISQPCGFCFKVWILIHDLILCRENTHLGLCCIRELWKDMQQKYWFSTKCRTTSKWIHMAAMLSRLGPRGAFAFSCHCSFMAAIIFSDLSCSIWDRGDLPGIASVRRELRCLLKSREALEVVELAQMPHSTITQNCRDSVAWTQRSCQSHSSNTIHDRTPNE